MKFSAALISTILVTGVIRTDAQSPKALDQTTICHTNDSILHTFRYEGERLFNGPAFQILSQPSNGRASIEDYPETPYRPPKPLAFKYVPDAGFEGLDSLTWKVTDGNGESGVGTVRILVQGPRERDGRSIILIVESEAYQECTMEVDRLKGDLESEGYSVVFRVTDEQDELEIHKRIKQEYEKPGAFLDGALLVGNVPRSYTATGTYTETPYMLLHGDYGGYANGDFEIWCSRITIENERFGNKYDLLKRALDANHYYRTGQLRYRNVTYSYGKDFGAVDPEPLKVIWENAEVGEESHRFLPDRKDLPKGMDCLLKSGGYMNEISHGNNNNYAGMGVGQVMHMGFQIHFATISSCHSGSFGGIMNHHLVTRGGGNVLSLGASITGGCPGIASTDRVTTKFLSKLARGESFGRAMIMHDKINIARIYGIGSITYFGDASVPVAQFDENGEILSNIPPSITQLTVEPSRVLAGQTVSGQAVVVDEDAEDSDDSSLPFALQVEWFTDYNYGRNDPELVQTHDQSSWTTTADLTLDKPHVFNLRAEAMDRWRARYWREAKVVVGPDPDKPLRIDCQGQDDWVDSEGREWLYDQRFEEGTWGHESKKIRSNDSDKDVEGTEDDYLYSNQMLARADTVYYRIPLKRGAYTVSLGFADMWSKDEGERVLDVFAQGEKWLDNLDVYAQAGAKTAFVKSTEVNLQNDILEVSFVRDESSSEDPSVAWIEIIPENYTAAVPIHRRNKPASKMGVTYFDCLGRKLSYRETVRVPAGVFFIKKHDPESGRSSITRKTSVHREAHKKTGH